LDSSGDLAGALAEVLAQQQPSEKVSRARPGKTAAGRSGSTWGRLRGLSSVSRHPEHYACDVEVKLRNPDRTVSVDGPTTVYALLSNLDIVPESVLVIREATLLTRDERLEDSDVVEIRPVLSGGIGERLS
jgi:sulfur carrier protein ThiS